MFAGSTDEVSSHQLRVKQVHRARRKEIRCAHKIHKWRTHQEVAEAVTEEVEVVEEEHPEAEAEAVVEACLRLSTRENQNPLHNDLRIVYARHELSLISYYAGGFGDRGVRGGARGRGAPRGRGRGGPRGGGGARGGAKTIVVSIPICSTFILSAYQANCFVGTPSSSRCLRSPWQRRSPNHQKPHTRRIRLWREAHRH